MVVVTTGLGIGPMYALRRDSKASKYSVPFVVVSTPATAPSLTRSMRRALLSKPVNVVCEASSIHQATLPVVDDCQSSSITCDASVMLAQLLYDHVVLLLMALKRRQ